jgi:hypothetical protein
MVSGDKKPPEVIYPELHLSDVGKVSQDEHGWLFHDLRFSDGSTFRSRRKAFLVAYNDALEAVELGNVERWERGSRE